MNFVAVRSQNVMSIDNAKVQLDVSNRIAPNIEIFSWNGSANTGSFEYNSGLRVVLHFDDLEPYIEVFLNLVNGWINAAASASPALTLQQAKEIKKAAVDALFNSKRKRPFLSTYWYDGTDEAVAYMTAAMVASDASAGGGGIAGDLTALINRYNHNVLYVNNMNAYEAMDANYGWVYRTTVNWQYVRVIPTTGAYGSNQHNIPWAGASAGNFNYNQLTGPAGSGPPPAPYLSNPPPGRVGAGHPYEAGNAAGIYPPGATTSSGAFQPTHGHPVNMSAQSVAGTFQQFIYGGQNLPAVYREMLMSDEPGGGAVVITRDPISWQPQGFTAPFDIPYATFAQAVYDVQRRRVKLDEHRTMLKNRLQNAGNIATVLATDISNSTNWPTA